jgi:hypothetical protein
MQRSSRHETLAQQSRRSAHHATRRWHSRADAALIKSRDAGTAEQMQRSSRHETLAQQTQRLSRHVQRPSLASNVIPLAKPLWRYTTKDVYILGEIRLTLHVQNLSFHKFRVYSVHEEAKVLQKQLVHVYSFSRNNISDAVFSLNFAL